MCFMSKVQLRKAYFEQNTAIKDIATIAISIGSSGNVSDTTIKNSHVSNGAGAISVTFNSSLSLSGRNHFVHNTAAIAGGAIYITTSNSTSEELTSS